MPDTVTAFPDSVADGVSDAKLRQYIDQLLGQRDRVKAEQDHYAAILANVQAEGYDKRIVQELVKRLVADEKTVQQHDELLDLYEAAYRRASGEVRA
jgi:uncharacterized protein (UPF0335 family)